MKRIKGYTIFYILGIFLLCESLLLFVATGVSLYYREHAGVPLALSALLTMGTGFVFWFVCKTFQTSLDKRTGYLLVSLIWVVMSLFGSLPFYLGEYTESYADAFFETMSGFTTTGATIFSDIESLPKGILMWRALTHLIGGIGIVVVVLALIPSLGSSGFSLFSAEVPGPSKDKFRPKLRDNAVTLIKIYMVINMVFILAFFFSGMSVFEAVCTAFSIAATGGFLITNDGAASYTVLQQYLTIFCMFIGGMNFTLIYRLFRGDGHVIRRNEELNIYVVVVLVTSFFITCGLLFYRNINDFEPALRHSLFHVLAIMTTTGVVATDYTVWGEPLIFITFLLILSGAMSGSTSGGLKMVRHIVLFKNVKQILSKTLHAGASYAPLRLNGKVVSEKVLYNILSISLLFLLTSVVATLMLIPFEGDVEKSLGAVVACLNNVGPGLGECGGFGNYSSLLPESKWILSACMYLGRLEIASVLILFSAQFRKR